MLVIVTSAVWSLVIAVVWAAGAVSVYPFWAALSPSSVMVQVDPALTFLDFSEVVAPVAVNRPVVPSVQL